MARPSRSELVTLIRQHHGSLSAIAEDRGVSRQAVTGWVKAEGLEQDAAARRARSGMPGPRPLLERGSADPDGEAAKIERRIAKHGSASAAAKSLGVSRRALYRARARLGIV